MRRLQNSGVSTRRGYLLRHSREERPLRNSSWYISRGALAVILNGAERSEESKAFARKTALSWDETLWILRCTQNDIQPGCRAGYAKVSENGNLKPFFQDIAALQTAFLDSCFRRNDGEGNSCGMTPQLFKDLLPQEWRPQCFLGETPELRNRLNVVKGGLE